MVGAGVNVFDAFIDNDVQYLLNSDDEEFWGDLGLCNFSSSLGKAYPTTVLDQVMDLLENGSLQGQSGLDAGSLFDKLPASILIDDDRLSAASWVLQAYNNGRNGTLISHLIGFIEVIKLYARGDFMWLTLCLALVRIRFGIGLDFWAGHNSNESCWDRKVTLAEEANNCCHVKNYLNPCLANCDLDS